MGILIIVLACVCPWTLSACRFVTPPSLSCPFCCLCMLLSGTLQKEWKVLLVFSVSSYLALFVSSAVKTNRLFGLTKCKNDLLTLCLQAGTKLTFSFVCLIIICIWYFTEKYVKLITFVQFVHFSFMVWHGMVQALWINAMKPLQCRLILCQVTQITRNPSTHVIC